MTAMEAKISGMLILFFSNYLPKSLTPIDLYIQRSFFLVWYDKARLCYLVRLVLYLDNPEDL